MRVLGVVSGGNGVGVVVKVKVKWRKLKPQRN